MFVDNHVLPNASDKDQGIQTHPEPKLQDAFPHRPGLLPLSHIPGYVKGESYYLNICLKITFNVVLDMR